MNSSKIFTSFLALFLITAFAPMPGLAADIVPFATRNQSPLISIFGLPVIGGYSVATKGSKHVRLAADLASNYVNSATADEHIILDGESLRLSLQGRYGLGENLEIGIEIPFLVVGGGFLDNFIIDYHDAFGFPQGGRDSAPRHRLLYLYKKNSTELLRKESSGSGLGDINFTCGWQFYRNQGDSPGAASVRAALKLPTGDSDRLHGSGSTDMAVWLVAGKEFPMPRGHLVTYGAAGILAMTNAKVLKDQQRNLVGFGNLGIGWNPFSFLSLKVQADAHSSFYRDSGLREIDSYSIQLTLGGTITLGNKTYLDIGVAEDLIVGSAPDVVFHLALRRTF